MFRGEGNNGGCSLYRGSGIEPFQSSALLEFSVERAPSPTDLIACEILENLRFSCRPNSHAKGILIPRGAIAVTARRAR